MPSPRSLLTVALQLTSRNDNSCYGGISTLKVLDDPPVPAGHVVGLAGQVFQVFEEEGVL